jgi:hypothetical protein
MLKLLIILLFVSGFVFSTAFAATGISLVRSNSCIKVNCISLAELIKYDNSTQKYSGKIVFDNKTGDYIRQKGMNHSFDFYKTEKGLVIFVLPDKHTLTYTKKIIIEPTLPEFALASQKNKKQLDSLTDFRQTSWGMFADKGCHNLTIGIKQVNITQAIKYLADNCPDGENPLLNNFTTTKKNINHCGNDCQYKLFIKEAKKQSKSFLLPFKHRVTK